MIFLLINKLKKNQFSFSAKLSSGTSPERNPDPFLKGTSRALRLHTIKSRNKDPRPHKTRCFLVMGSNRRNYKWRHRSMEYKLQVNGERQESKPYKSMYGKKKTTLRYVREGKPETAWDFLLLVWGFQLLPPLRSERERPCKPIYWADYIIIKVVEQVGFGQGRLHIYKW